MTSKKIHVGIKIAIVSKFWISQYVRMFCTPKLTTCTIPNPIITRAISRA